jgi:FAD/FMN-containing dehydrogenase
MWDGLWVFAITAGALPVSASAVLGRRTAIEDCLVGAGVPIDVQGSMGWAEDVSPFNLRVPYTPAAIAVPKNVGHIQNAVACARKLGLKASPKSGGHSYASLGFGGEDGHLMIELDRMNKVTVGAGYIATIEAGARLGYVATELFAQGGRAIAHGTCPG